MFDFYETDWFTISLEILFLIFIAYDLKKYFQTRKRQYLLNVVLTLGFFIWAIVPFYNKYFTWQESDRANMIKLCNIEHNNSQYCECVDDRVFKEYTMKEYKKLHEAKDKDFIEFMKETLQECKED